MDKSAVIEVTAPLTNKPPRAMFGGAKKHLPAKQDPSKSPSKATRSFLPSSVSDALASSTLKMPHPLKWKVPPINAPTPSFHWTHAGTAGRRSRSSTMSSASGCENEDLSVSLATPLLHTPPTSCPRKDHGSPSPEDSPLTPDQLSFDQLIFSNQTLKVSLTPDTCLDAGSSMKSRQWNDSLNSPNESSGLLDSQRFAMTAEEALAQKKVPRSPLVHGQPRLGALFTVEDSDEEVMLGEESEGCGGQATTRLESLAEFLDSEPPWETFAQTNAMPQVTTASNAGAMAGGRSLAARKKSRKSWLTKLHS